MTDVSHLREISSKVRSADVHLFTPRVTPVRPRGFGQGYGGARPFRASNPRPGVTIAWHTKAKPKEASLRIEDLDGKTVRRLKAEERAGFQRVRWDLRRQGRGRRGRERRQGRLAPNGTYFVVLEIDGKTLRKVVEVAGGSGSSARRPVESEEVDDA